MAKAAVQRPSSQPETEGYDLLLAAEAGERDLETSCERGQASFCGDDLARDSGGHGTRG